MSTWNDKLKRALERVKNAMPNPRSPLRRSRESRMIAGVCGGLAEWLRWDPTLVRILYVAGSILSAAFPGLIVYLILWAVMPEEDLAAEGIEFL